MCINFSKFPKILKRYLNKLKLKLPWPQKVLISDWRGGVHYFLGNFSCNSSHN